MIKSTETLYKGVFLHYHVFDIKYFCFSGSLPIAIQGYSYEEITEINRKKLLEINCNVCKLSYVPTTEALNFVILGGIHSSSKFL